MPATPSAPAVPSPVQNQDLPDFEAAVAHIESAIEQVYKCVSHIPDDFYAHKCMDDHATAVARLTDMKRALTARRNELRILANNSASSRLCVKS